MESHGPNKRTPISEAPSRLAATRVEYNKLDPAAVKPDGGRYYRSCVLRNPSGSNASTSADEKVISSCTFNATLAFV